MYKIVILFVVPILFIMFLSCSEDTSRKDQRQELIEADVAWTKAIEEGDIEKIFSFWTDDVVIYPASVPVVRGIDSVRKFLRRNRQAGFRPKITPLEFGASDSGDLGYIIGDHEWIDSEGNLTRPGRYVTLWRKNEQGEWKCFLEIHSPKPIDNVSN